MVKGVAVLAAVTIAVALGFGAALAVTAGLNAVLPPFNEEVDDDTLREYGPVAIAYLTWIATAVTIIFVGVRRLR